MADDVPELRSRSTVRIAIALAVLAGVLTVTAIVWVLVTSGNVRSPTAAEKHALADEACPQVTAGHFYKITKAGKTSFLLGTRHAGVSLRKYPAVVAEAFRGATVAVFESLDDDKPRPVEPPAQGVEAMLGPDDWAKYRELVGDEIADRVHDRSVQTATAALSLLYEDTSQTVDLELEALARASGKQLVGLEDRDRTDHLAEKYLGVDTLRTALEQITHRELLESEIRRNLREYCSGQRAASGAFDQVTNERTRSWVPKLEPLLEKGGVFVAVGVDHVDGGTLDLGKLIEHDGFEVTAVP